MIASRSIISPLTKQPFRMKFGFHSGPAVGGIVGNRNYQYCLFGDTINTASRVATCSEVGKIHFSATSYEILKDSLYFETAYRGNTEMKGKGSMDTYWLLGPTETYLSLLETAKSHTVTISDLQTKNKEEAAILTSNTTISTHLKAPNITFQDNNLTDPTKHNIFKNMKKKQLLCPFSGTNLL
ncbi:hypothetical protein I4U23_000089 [Adineta vaga]|nr:hypothetical protein I4U23_000089 [Adineta vaga]